MDAEGSSLGDITWSSWNLTNEIQKTFWPCWRSILSVIFFLWSISQKVVIVSNKFMAPSRSSFKIDKIRPSKTRWGCVAFKNTRVMAFSESSQSLTITTHFELATKRRPCQIEVTADQTIPDQSVHWSGWSALETPCALGVPSMLVVSDKTLPDGNYLWSDQNQTIVQTIAQPWPKPNPHNCSDNFCSKSLLVRLLSARNSLWSDSIALEVVW